MTYALFMSNVEWFDRLQNGIVSREADHRVANSLSAISSMVRVKARGTSIGDARQILLDVSGRIDAVARLHRLLADTNKADVPLAQFLRDVCGAMASAAADEDQFKVSVECSDGLTLRPQAALPLGLLAAELFSNSAKYAHPTGLPTVVRIACHSGQDGMISFIFEDDGVGFPENFDPARNESLGMKIAKSLSDQLRGQCEWRDLGIGLRFVCRFPAQ
jgi:two-component sensor histidine kinase